MARLSDVPARVGPGLSPERPAGRRGRSRRRLGAVVVAHSGRDAVLLLDRPELERIGGELERFRSALDAAVEDAGLAWPAPSAAPRP